MKFENIKVEVTGFEKAHKAMNGKTEFYAHLEIEGVASGREYQMTTMAVMRILGSYNSNLNRVHNVESFFENNKLMFVKDGEFAVKRVYVSAKGATKAEKERLVKEVENITTEMINAEIEKMEKEMGIKTEEVEEVAAVEVETVEVEEVAAEVERLTAEKEEVEKKLESKNAEILAEIKKLTACIDGIENTFKELHEEYPEIWEEETETQDTEQAQDTQDTQETQDIQETQGVQGVQNANNKKYTTDNKIQAYRGRMSVIKAYLIKGNTGNVDNKVNKETAALNSS